MRNKDEILGYVIWRKTNLYPWEIDSLDENFLDTAFKIAEDIKNRMNDIEFFSLESENYPKLLSEIQRPPYGIFCKGDCGVLKGEMFSIVGTRKSSGYGESLARKFARELSKEFVIVSGMAYGIDSKAHEGAIESGYTIAALASGVDVPSPKGNSSLYKKILKKGCVISPYAPGDEAKRYRFVERNSIIAGLSIGTLVIEAPKKSGSLITASIAADFGRDVFAIPGDVGKYRSEGTNYLIKTGAMMVTDPSDILEYYGKNFEERKVSNPVYDLVKKGFGDPEEIADVLGIPIVDVLSELSELEIDGFVQKGLDDIYRPL